MMGDGGGAAEEEDDLGSDGDEGSECLIELKN